MTSLEGSPLVSNTAPHLFVFGLGYSARALADLLTSRGWRVSATCRTPDKAETLRVAGVESHLFDAGAPLDADGLAALASATHLLSSVPPGADGDPVLAAHAGDIRAAAPFDWIGYLSTTGVYGDRDGGWVDEDSALEPTGPRGQRRVDAEAAWFDLEDAGPVHAFRLAGIYGPGRSALDTVRSGRGRRIVKPGQVFSRIHIDDIVAIVDASMAKPRNGAAYNCCDDEAAPPQDVIAFACELLGEPVPPDVPYATADLSEMARSFYRDNKRVSNARIKEELGVTLRWPTYRDALRAML
jgi:nucleoside-diphosphate-sugar epimerase